MLNPIDLVLLNENGDKTANVGDDVVFLMCLGHGCLKKFRENEGFEKANNNIIAKRVYGETQMVVCPHCGQKLKVRFYKKGSVRIEIR